MPNRKHLHILIIDDDEEDFFITSEYLKSIHNGYNFTIEWCGRFKEALEKICAGKHDLFLLTIGLVPKPALI